LNHKKPYHHLDNALNGKNDLDKLNYIHINKQRPLFNQLLFDENIRSLITMLWNEDISKRKYVQLPIEMTTMILEDIMIS